MSEDVDFSLTMRQAEGLEFQVRFDWQHLPVLILDEPVTGGDGRRLASSGEAPAG